MVCRIYQPQLSSCSSSIHTTWKKQKFQISMLVYYALESLEPTDSLAMEQPELVQSDVQLLTAVLKALVSRRISVAQ